MEEDKNSDGKHHQSPNYIKQMKKRRRKSQPKAKTCVGVTITSKKGEVKAEYEHMYKRVVQRWVLLGESRMGLNTCGPQAPIEIARS